MQDKAARRRSTRKGHRGMSDVLGHEAGHEPRLPPGRVFWVVFAGEEMLSRPLTLCSGQGGEVLAVFSHKEEADMLVRSCEAVGQGLAREEDPGLGGRLAAVRPPLRGHERGPRPAAGDADRRLPRPGDARTAALRRADHWMWDGPRRRTRCRTRVDGSAGALFVCTTGGNPATWRKVTTGSRLREPIRTRRLVKPGSNGGPGPLLPSPSGRGLPRS